MNPYWVIYPSGRFSPECVEAASADEAERIARDVRGVAPVSVQTLPYPAHPRLDHPSAPASGFPSFCWKPNECRGKTSCPRRISCTE